MNMKWFSLSFIFIKNLVKYIYFQHDCHRYLCVINIQLKVPATRIYMVISLFISMSSFYSYWTVNICSKLYKDAMYWCIYQTKHMEHKADTREKINLLTQMS
jgi:hypothetical protein